MNIFKSYQILLLFILLSITFLTFSPIITASYARLDDHLMLRSENRRALKDLSLKNIIDTFKYPHEGLYHPIVTISYSMEKTLFGFFPEMFHFDNILLHIVNIFLVFFIFLNLTKSFWLSFIITTLFAFHPTRVEVVSWISARKDTLYSLFFLSSILFYIKTYNSTKTKKYIFLSLICFLLACFSKAMAITLPLIIILIDFYSNNLSKSKYKIYLLYVFIATIFIFLAIKIHYSNDFMVVHFNSFNHYINFINAHFNILFYLDKLLLPINLYCMYPFFYNKFSLPPTYILYSPCILYIIFLIVFLTLKKTKVIFFGFMFFIITIIPVSGILTIGDFAVADRYTYLPYIGLFFIFAKFIIYIYNKYNKNKSVRISVIILCITCFILLNYLSYKRVLDWKYNNYGHPATMKYYKFGVIK